MTKSALHRGVDKAGSQSEFARLIGSTQQNVSYWLTQNKLLPAEYVFKASAATGIGVHEYRPDMFMDDGTPRLTAAEQGEGSDEEAGAGRVILCSQCPHEVTAEQIRRCDDPECPQNMREAA